MIDLVAEEMSHFKMVHDLLIERGFVLGRERKDEYVNQLMQFFPKGGSREDHLVHKLLYAALIEARSCERFRLLSEKLKNKQLARFYNNLMISEANHYTMFLQFARTYGGRKKTDQKWKSLLAFEGKLIKRFGTKETMHG